MSSPVTTSKTQAVAGKAIRMPCFKDQCGGNRQEFWKEIRDNTPRVANCLGRGSATPDTIQWLSPWHGRCFT